MAVTRPVMESGAVVSRIPNALHEKALFVRKINGLYAMLSRQDSENIYLMFSDNVHFWYEPRILLKPVFPVGNGSNRQLRVADRD